MQRQAEQLGKSKMGMRVHFLEHGNVREIEMTLFHAWSNFHCCPSSEGFCKDHSFLAGLYNLVLLFLFERTWSMW